MSLERTPEAQRAHDAALAAQNVTRAAAAVAGDIVHDPFTDDEPLACGVENPETCESCQ